MGMLNDIAGSRLMEMRPGTEPLEEELKLKPDLCAVMQGMHKGNGNVQPLSKGTVDERFIWEYEQVN